MVEKNGEPTPRIEVLTTRLKIELPGCDMGFGFKLFGYPWKPRRKGRAKAHKQKHNHKDKRK